MSHIRPKRALRAEVALAQEQRDELLAPAAQRQAVVAPDGTVVRDARVERGEWRDPDDDNPQRRAPLTVRGFRAVDMVQRLYLDGHVTTSGLTAATRLTDDYELAGGARPGYVRPEAGTSGTCGVGPGAVQLDAIGRYRAAVQAVGQVGCAVLLPVVLGNKEPRDRAAFRAALDRLEAHYEDAVAPRNNTWLGTVSLL